MLKQERVVNAISSGITQGCGAARNMAYQIRNRQDPFSGLE